MGRTIIKKMILPISSDNTKKGRDCCMYRQSLLWWQTMLYGIV